MYDYHHLPHHKQQNRSKKTLWVTLILTLFFTIVEIIGGIMSNSLALLSDSAHMISDVIALALSMTAIYLSTRTANSRYTYGYLRFEIIASFLNGLALAIIAIGIFIEGIRRAINPEEINLQLMLVISCIGLVVNIILTTILSRSIKTEENLNIQSALWHFFGDLLSSIGVILSAIIIYYTGFNIFDPIISMVIGAIIFVGGAKIIHESYLILMESVPRKFDLDEIRAKLNEIEGVEDVHELHLWSISSNHYSLSTHVFTDNKIQPFDIILSITNMLKDNYGIVHSTIQTEHVDIHPHGQYGRDFKLTHTSS